MKNRGTLDQGREGDLALIRENSIYACCFDLFWVRENVAVLCWFACSIVVLHLASLCYDG